MYWHLGTRAPTVAALSSARLRSESHLTIELRVGKNREVRRLLKRDRLRGRRSVAPAACSSALALVQWREVTRQEPTHSFRADGCHDTCRPPLVVRERLGVRAVGIHHE